RDRDGVRSSPWDFGYNHAPVTILWDAYRSALGSIAQAVGRTPLVTLNRVTAGVTPPIHVKLEWYGATGSLKDRIYLHMFDRPEARATWTSRSSVWRRSARVTAPATGYPASSTTPTTSRRTTGRPGPRSGSRPAESSAPLSPRRAAAARSPASAASCASRTRA